MVQTVEIILDPASKSVELERVAPVALVAETRVRNVESDRNPFSIATELFHTVDDRRWKEDNLPFLGRMRDLVSEFREIAIRTWNAPNFLGSGPEIFVDQILEDNLATAVALLGHLHIVHS